MLSSEVLFEHRGANSVRCTGQQGLESKSVPNLIEDDVALRRRKGSRRVTTGLVATRRDMSRAVGQPRFQV